jgi:hypothetical protein
MFGYILIGCCVTCALGALGDWIDTSTSPVARLIDKLFGYLLFGWIWLWIGLFIYYIILGG